jgi:imidazolonepropionase-like amidohydrolase
MTHGTFPEKPSFWQEELNVAVQEAELFGLPTIAHCLSDEGTLRAIRAGVDSIDHCAFFIREEHGWLERRYNHEVAVELRDSGKSVMMGLSAGYHRHDPYRDGSPPTENAQFLLEQETRMLEIFGRLTDLGIPPVVGTDAGVALTPFDETFLELVLMNKAGLSPQEVIKAATSAAARVLGLDHQIGKIATGLHADLIAIPHNPLEDVSAFKDVDWVMHNGKIVRDDRSKTM